MSEQTWPSGSTVRRRLSESGVVATWNEFAAMMVWRKFGHRSPE